MKLYFISSLKVLTFQDLQLNKHYLDQGSQANPNLRNTTSQATPQLMNNTTQATPLYCSKTTQCSPTPLHHRSTQHSAELPLTLSYTDSVSSNDSAIDTCSIASADSDTQTTVETMCAESQASDDKLLILLEELEHTKLAHNKMDALLSYFYIPDTQLEANDQIEHLRNYINNIQTNNKDTDKKSIALLPSTGPTERLAGSESIQSYLSAVNNSPERSETAVGDYQDTFSSFEYDTATLHDDLRLKLDLAYKVPLYPFVRSEGT